MVHRDIRSENIVITNHGIAKITNFKFSRRFGEATSNISVNKECVRYSAPEIMTPNVKFIVLVFSFGRLLNVEFHTSNLKILW
uniref:Protein kinase domain-containing protein n=1 Tax=Rhizophagus irregularis (strain DAOM 181602 / DAOM 197198 / MUCL 43194) TaxID=747089 RepID=U9UUP0_RHIID